MPSFDWREVAEFTLDRRFPEWAAGREVWYGLEAPDYDLLSLLDRLVKLRGEANWGTYPLECPRVFISHKQQDASEALAIARIAHDAGFQFWLDIMDPALQKPPVSGRNACNKTAAVATDRRHYRHGIVELHSCSGGVYQEYAQERTSAL